MVTRTLVAEDDADIRELIAMLLRRAGHDVVEVCNGQEALEALWAAPFDLVVTDHDMPRRTGAQVVEHVVSTKLSTAVLLISADHAIASVVPRAVDHVRFLAKPFDSRTLLGAVGGLIVSPSPVRSVLPH